MSRIVAVFLSSVAKGLEPHRDAIRAALNSVDWMKCVGMEDFGARNADSYATCLGRLKSCDVFVGIAGPRYGSKHEMIGRSFSEIEFEEALAVGMPIYMFLTEKSFPLPANLIESDADRVLQDNFRVRVEELRQVSYFLTADDLVRSVQSALLNDAHLSGIAKPDVPAHVNFSEIEVGLLGVV